MQLTKNSRFVEEYNQWREKISKISDDGIKKELNLWLSSLTNAVKKIDVAHNSFGITNPNNELISVREEITSIRKKISNKISECERAGLIK
jgi:hypothetical protein